MFDQFQSITMRSFSEDYWAPYRESDEEYFNSFLGTRYLTPIERDAIRKPNARPSAMLQRAYESSHRKVAEISRIVRGALLPHPELAVRKKVKRKPLHDRIELGEIGEHAERLLQAKGYADIAKQNALIIQITEKYGQLED